MNILHFYSIGVGNEENWRHLKELTEAHGYDQIETGVQFLDIRTNLFKRNHH